MSAESAAQEVVQGQDAAQGVQIPKEEEGFRVYVGNLSYKTTEDQLREFVSKIGGEITSVTIPLRFGKRPAGYGFVNYKTEDGAKAAVEQLQGSTLEDRKLDLQIARSREEQESRREKNKERRAAKAAERKAEAGEAGAGGAETEGEAKPRKSKPKRAPRRRVPGEEGEETLVEGETTAGGETSDAAPKAPKKRNSKAKKAKEARIDAVEGEEGAEAVEATKKERQPRERKPRGPKLQLTDEQSPNTIFVANLPFTVDDEALASIFTNLSIRVKSAKVVRGMRTGRGGRPFRASRGFGFVEVEDASQQKEAVEKVEGSLVGDRKISAKIANEMKPVEVEEVAQAEAATA